VHYYKGHVGLLINQSGMINPDGCQRGEWYLAFGPSKLYGNGRFNHGIPFKRYPFAFYVEGCVQGLPAIVNVVSNNLE